MTVLNAIVLRMQAEILADIKAKRVPRSVRSFSQLHKYVDANEYGGFCEEGSEANKKVFGADGHVTDAGIDFVNEAQGRVDRWLKAGLHITSFDPFDSATHAHDNAAWDI